MTEELKFKELNPTPEGFYITNDIYYEPQKGELELISYAFANGLHIAVDGPTGSGKSTLAEKMSYLFGIGYKDLPKIKDKNTQKKLDAKTEPYRKNGFPMYPVQGQEDLTSDDLIGREINIEGDWINGSALLASKYGGNLYLDEPTEARKDTLVVIHSLTDHRAILPVQKLGIVQKCHNSMIVMATYNSMYQDPRKKFKPSTSQRFVHIYLGYPNQELEGKIVRGHVDIDDESIRRILNIAHSTRNLALEKRVKEGASPREVINAAKLIKSGASPYQTLMATMGHPITQETEVLEAISEVVKNQGYKP